MTMAFLRKVKWLCYSLKLIGLFLFGRVLRAVPRKKRAIVLTGEISYTGGTYSYFKNLLDLFLEEGYNVSIILGRRHCKAQIKDLSEEKGVRLFIIPDTFVFVEHLLGLLRIILLRPETFVISEIGRAHV